MNWARLEKQGIHHNASGFPSSVTGGKDSSIKQLKKTREDRSSIILCVSRVCPRFIGPRLWNIGVLICCVAANFLQVGSSGNIAINI